MKGKIKMNYKNITNYKNAIYEICTALLGEIWYDFIDPKTNASFSDTKYQCFYIDMCDRYYHEVFYTELREDIIGNAPTFANIKRILDTNLNNPEEALKYMLKSYNFNEIDILAYTKKYASEYTSIKEETPNTPNITIEMLYDEIRELKELVNKLLSENAVNIPTVKFTKDPKTWTWDNISNAKVIFRNGSKEVQYNNLKSLEMSENIVLRKSVDELVKIFRTQNGDKYRYIVQDNSRLEFQFEE